MTTYAALNSLDAYAARAEVFPLLHRFIQTSLGAYAMVNVGSAAQHSRSISR